MRQKLFDVTSLQTRKFGFKDPYYTNLGFDGHEGGDYVPTPAQATPNVYSVSEGIVIKVTNKLADDPAWAGYGKKVVVWDKANLRLWWYCHLDSTAVTLGQNVQIGTKIGVMGNTTFIAGVAFGKHLHLGTTKTNAVGARINTNNGYKGFEDPEPLLQVTTPVPPQGGDDEAMLNEYEKKALEKLRQFTIDNHHGNAEGAFNALVGDHDEVQRLQTDLNAAQAQIGSLNSTIVQLQGDVLKLKQQLADQANEDIDWGAQLHEAQKQLEEVKRQVDRLEVKNNQIEQDLELFIDTLANELNVSHTEEAVVNAVGDVLNENDELKKQVGQPPVSKSNWQKVLDWLAHLLGRK